MHLQQIILNINNFHVTEDMEDYEISEFFDAIGENLPDTSTLTDLEKEHLIQSLFGFLKRQDATLEEDFSFINVIEAIDKPDYKVYYPALIKFNSEYATLNSTFLLNRFINALEGEEREKSLQVLKAIAVNTSYAESVRAHALDFYKYQTEH
ncbi:hypothetical protein ACJOV8_012895 [Formosa sp. 3Alg 14/1]|uniref:hypothetical protein n=1 Tax=Formosa sp. 3Alg 14/1 TaxID=3382190 RepID=UPI0039BE9BCD